MKLDVTTFLRLFGVVAMVALFSLSANGQEQEESGKDDQEPPTIADKIQQIKDDYEEMVSELTDEYRDAESAEARKEIVVRRRASELELANRAITLLPEIEIDLGKVALLSWISGNCKGEARSRVNDLLLKEFVESKGMTEWVRSLSRAKTPTPAIENALRTLMDKSPHDEVQGYAAISLASYFKQMADMTPAARRRLGEIVGSDYVDKWHSDKSMEELERLLVVCSEKYADVKTRGRESVGDQVKAIKKLLRFYIGKIAPEIEGEDIDGESFKLSDYRGRVVVIDFWGDW